MISRFVLRLYDRMSSRRSLLFSLLLLLTAALAISALRQTYKEDISDFLPLSSRQGDAMKVYQEISGAQRIFAVFQCSDSARTEPDSITAAIDDFVALLQRDSVLPPEGVTAVIDAEEMMRLTDFVCDNIPYFLLPEDYARMDSLLAREDYVTDRMSQNRQLLMLPGSSTTARMLCRDPLMLFSPVLSALQSNTPSLSWENYDGYIFSPDMQRAYVMMSSPFGTSETNGNGRLIDRLRRSADESERLHPSVRIHFTGGPVIAVGNARQIRSDSILAISLSLTLILLLLLRVFRSVRHLLLMLLAISWGWLFAMGILALFHDGISLIVVGISSVILGLAVNYPLHFIAHLRHSASVRQALRETLVPLTVGNITTVGAFLTLVPLESAALRDLGLFSALLLAGTVLFTLLFLPHLVQMPRTKGDTPLIRRLAGFSLEGRMWLLWPILLITLFLGWKSLDAGFDADISHINFMTPEQHEDMNRLHAVQSAATDGEELFVVTEDSTLDAALTRRYKLSAISCHLSPITRFLPSPEEQKERLALWRDFLARHREQLTKGLNKAAQNEGFNASSFEQFCKIVGKDFAPVPAERFAPLTETVLARNVISDSVSGRHCVVDILRLKPQELETAKAQLGNASPATYVFTLDEIHTSLASRLSDSFNYIGWACAVVVFFFLWASFGHIELALISFLPMAVSWLWILGLMSLLDIQFNVVNIILATFIFGQGDDYTIFITEGCQYEYAYRRRMLSSYKQSIIVSALIMFIGIGALIFARHPALFSLAEVTVVGMSSVVLTACLLPPLVFRWITRKGDAVRLRPLSLRALLFPPRKDDFAELVRDRYRYKGREIYGDVCRTLRRRTDELNRLSSRLSPEAPCFVWGGHWGESALLLALLRPNADIVAFVSDEERLTVALHSSETAAPKLHFVTAYTHDIMKEKIRTMLEDALPLVNFDSDFLFSELDSLGVTTILMMLSEAFDIRLDSSDATPKNLKTLDSLVDLVERKLAEKQ
jgi:predicted exporter/acyl carrier protein